jgi:hypothetical protein
MCAHVANGRNCKSEESIVQLLSNALVVGRRNNEYPATVCSREWDQVTGGWRELHNEELQELYFSSSTTGLMK